MSSTDTSPQADVWQAKQQSIVKDARGTAERLRLLVIQGGQLLYCLDHLHLNVAKKDAV